MIEEGQKTERRREVQVIKRIIGPNKRSRGAFLPGLFACRMAAGVSQAELAALAQVARTTIRSLESGDRRAQATTFRRISEALGVTPAELLTAAAEEE